MSPKRNIHAQLTSCILEGKSLQGMHLSGFLKFWCNNFISELIPVNLHLKYLLIIISWNPQVILLYNFTSWFFIQIVFAVYFTQRPYTFLAKLLIIQWYDNSVCLYCHQVAHFSVYNVDCGHLYRILIRSLLLLYWYHLWLIVCRNILFSLLLVRC